MAELAKRLLDLAQQAIWVGWKIVTRKRKDGTEVDTKVPINPHTGDGASSTDATTWGTREQALAAVSRYRLTGIGIILTTLSSGLRLCGLDTDQCYRDGEESVADWARPIHALLDGHLSEASPSGSGRHHLFLVDPTRLPDGAADRVDFAQGGKRKPERYGFELYLSEGRYFTVTDNDIEGELQMLEPSQIVRLVNLLEDFSPVAKPAKPKTPVRPRKTHHHDRIDDHDKAIEIIEHLPNSGSYAGYTDWLRVVGSAFNATGGSSAGLEAVRTWTENGGYDFGGVDDLWRYFNRKPPRHLDIRHLINQARDQNYEPYPLQEDRPNSRSSNGHTHWDEDEPLGDHIDTGRMVNAPKVKPFDLENASAARWRDQDVPVIEFIVADLLPHYTASIVGGDSGSGKSIIMQTLCTCVASLIDLDARSGKPFLGYATMGGKAVYITAEDGDEVVHHRHHRIMRSLNLGWDDFADRLYLKSMADNDIWLFRNGRPTGLAEALCDEIELMTGVTLLVIDSAALVFDDDEIKRAPVASFLRYINRAARRLRCAIVLIAHTSRTSTATTKSMVSGSTAWVAHARAGIFLETNDDQSEVTLSLIKTNYAKKGFTADLLWDDNGVLVPRPRRDDKVSQIEDANDERKIMEEIRRCWTTAWPLSLYARSGARFIGRVMHERHKMKSGHAVKLATSMVVRGDVLERRSPRGSRINGLCPKDLDPDVH